MLNTSNAVRIPSKTPTTRVAFLILAHHEPKLLHRLLERLSADWAHCFVHVDRKADIKQFQDEVPRKNVTFLPMSQRVSVHWCGYSASSAILNLMRYAMTSAHQPSRFVLLSGVDYPIRSMDHIGQAISEDKEFIHIDREIDSTGDSSFDRCLNRRFLGDSKLFNPRTAPVVVDRLVRRLEKWLVRRHPRGLRVFYGPTWWTLTREAVLEALAYVEENPSIVRWFSGARVPDESMLHTIIKASSRSASIAFDATRLDEPPFGTYRHALHYIDWTTGPGRPKTLEISDLGTILESGALFARKMHLHRSAELLDALDSSQNS
jgi:hypothetical protein